MKTKFRALALVLAILLGFSVLPSDVVAASGNGELLRDLGILKGDLEGNLLLDQPLKRQDAIVLLSRLLGVEELAENYPGEHSFSDVTNAYYDPFIAWAQDAGLTEGVGGGLFGFDQYLKNQQLLAFLLRALGYEFYGSEYGLVPAKSVELEISPQDEVWGETTTRLLMADRTVALLRKGRMKYGNITLERSLAINEDSVPSDGQVFHLETFSYKQGSAVLTFSSPSNDHNSTRSNLLRALIENGPSIDDIELTYSVLGTGHVTVLKLTQVFYDSTTGQMLATFPNPDIPDDKTVEISVNYIENRQLLLRNGTDIIVRKRPGRTYEPGEAQLILEEILRDILPSFSGSFSSAEFKNGILKPLSNSSANPLYSQNTTMGDNPLYSRTGGSIDIWTEILLEDSAASPDSDNLFIYVFIDGELIETGDLLTVTEQDGKLEAEINDLAAPEGSVLRLVSGYIKIDDIKGETAERHGLSDEEFRDFVDAVILNLHLSAKPDSLSAVNVFGKVTLNLDSFGINPLDGKTQSGVIVANSITNPELDSQIIVAVQGGDGGVVLKTFMIHDYGYEFIDEASAEIYFARHLDTDSDGDGLGDLVFAHRLKPLVVSKRIDKSTPLLMVADGGLGDNVTLYLEEGEVMFWSDGIDDDCDGFADETHLHTTTYIDTVSVDKETSSLRTGRNPQTGKEIKIAAGTTVIVTEADGTVKTITPQQFLNDFDGDGSPDFAKVVADEDNNAILVHVIKDAVVAYVDRTELAAGGPKVVYTNTDELSEEEIEYLISDEHDIELFVYRQVIGPVSGSSYRLWADEKMIEVIEYKNGDTQTKRVAKFKAGKALADTVKRTAGDDPACNVVIIGEPPDMHSHFVKFDGIDGESRAVVAVDSFFDIFTEVSVDFRGHVTVLK
ncbi:MAG: S-layer homology domain-containing protein [Clostridia bacterium]|nr:S-layer homology domain-containing protein [Clostridia bacterium]